MLAGSGCSFDEAERNLKELCHLQVSNDVVRQVCDEEGRDVRKWMKSSPEPKKAFDAAKGVVEFSTDGFKVNTVDGWREIRQSVISKRIPALAAEPEDWDKRVLEPPTVRLAAALDRRGGQSEAVATLGFKRRFGLRHGHGSADASGRLARWR